MMNVAFLTARFPFPPYRGDRLTASQLMRALSARHTVTLISFTDGSESPEAFREVAGLCRRVETVRLSPHRSWLQAWTGLFSAVPSQVAYYRSSAMMERVQREVTAGRFDAVFVQVVRMAPFAAELDHPAKVLFLADSLSLNLRRAGRFAPLWKRPGLAWERTRVARYEIRMSRMFRETWVVSDVDRLDLVKRGCENAITIPHGIDDRWFGLERRPADTPRIALIGNLGVPHNVDAAIFAARSIWPAIRSRLPGARLMLVGADARPEVRQLASIPGVEVTGALADLGPILATAHVMLAPLRFSTGVQNKVLEAMAAGLPVVTTPAVAEALRMDGPDYAWVAAEAPGLAEAVIECVSAPEEAQDRARRARDYVRKFHSWAAAVARLELLAAEGRNRGQAGMAGDALAAQGIRKPWAP